MRFKLRNPVDIGFDEYILDLKTTKMGPCPEAETCPYCGNNKLELDWEEYDMCRYDVTTFMIVCDNCRAQGPGYEYDSRKPTEERTEAIAKAIIAWNIGRLV